MLIMDELFSEINEEHLTGLYDFLRAFLNYDNGRYQYLILDTYGAKDAEELFELITNGGYCDDEEMHYLLSKIDGYWDLEFVDDGNTGFFKLREYIFREPQVEEVFLKMGAIREARE